MDTNDTPDPALAPHFDALRREMASLDSPRRVETELMQAFAQQFPSKPRWYQKLATPKWSIGASLGSIATVAVVFMLSLHAPMRSGAGVGAPLVGQDNGVAFIALESLERIEQEPAPRMVETEVPRTALAPLGVPVTPENAGDTVKAEMLVASDGQPLALRLTSLN
jgi:hypothetical protein